MTDAEYLLPILYTTTKPDSSEVKRCVVVMDRLRAVTFRHGAHLKFFLDQITQIYSIENGKLVNVKVVAVSDTADVVVFHTIEEEFTVYPRSYEQARLGFPYLMIGIDPKGRPNVKSGVVGKNRTAFMIGDHHAEDGDSGAAIISNSKFIGMVVGKQIYCPQTKTQVESIVTLNLSEVAAHFSYPKIVPTQVILGFLSPDENEMLEDEPPCKK